MGGPWFTVVQQSTDSWSRVGTLWLSDGDHAGKATLEVRVRLTPPITKR
ncbi:MAG: hypothetical protein JKY65_29650 [Planctomycetes bacterium]|nr:hypothetical protein [Planctomycetota bacterium]